MAETTRCDASALLTIVRPEGLQRMGFIMWIVAGEELAVAGLV